MSSLPSHPSNGLPESAPVSDEVLAERIKSHIRSGANTIIVSPDTLKKLIDLGIAVKRPELSPQEEVHQILSERLPHALALADGIPKILSPDRPTIQQLYSEIRLATLFGLYGSAITQCGILLEYVLKYVCYSWNRPEGEKTYDGPEWDRIVEGNTLGPTIALAKAMGIISDDEEKTLAIIKDEIRNPYNHFNIKKLTADVVFGGFKEVDMESGDHQEYDRRASTSPALFGQAKPWYDVKIIAPVLTDTINNVTALLKRLDKRREIDNPSGLA